MAAGIEKKASAQEDAKPTAQRTVVQNVEQNWDCSQIENEEEEEDEDWQKGDQMERYWNEDEKVEESEGGSLEAEVMQRVPDLVVHERMSQCEKSERFRRKRKS